MSRRWPRRARKTVLDSAEGEEEAGSPQEQLDGGGPASTLTLLSDADLRPPASKTVTK